MAERAQCGMSVPVLPAVCGGGYVVRWPRLGSLVSVPGRSDRDGLWQGVRDAHQVVRQRIPEQHGPDFLLASYQELPQSAVAGLSVDALGGGGALPVDGLGLLGPHARSPLRDGRGVIGAGLMRIVLRFLPFGN